MPQIQRSTTSSASPARPRQQCDGLEAEPGHKLSSCCSGREQAQARSNKVRPLTKSSTYRGIMLHRVTDVQHFSLLGIYRQVGTVPAEESWGQEEMEPTRETQCWSMRCRTGQAVPGMQHWPPACGLLAFLPFSSPLVLSTSCIQQQNGAHPFLSLMTIH